MSVARIVVIVLAVLLFGGVLLLAWKSRQGNGGDDQPAPAPINPAKDEDGSPFRPKERRKSK